MDKIREHSTNKAVAAANGPLVRRVRIDDHSVAIEDRDQIAAVLYKQSIGCGRRKTRYVYTRRWSNPVKRRERRGLASMSRHSILYARLHNAMIYCRNTQQTHHVQTAATLVYRRRTPLVKGPVVDPDMQDCWRLL
jgi:site-specific DNA-adenine methylase